MTAALHEMSQEEAEPNYPFMHSPGLALTALRIGPSLSPSTSGRLGTSNGFPFAPLDPLSLPTLPASPCLCQDGGFVLN